MKMKINPEANEISDEDLEAASEYFDKLIKEIKGEQSNARKS